MQIAITCVKDIGDSQARFFAEFSDFPQRQPELGSRDHAVLHDEVGAQPANRGKGTFSSLPNGCSLIRISSNLNRNRVGLLDQGLQPNSLRLDPVCRPVQFHNQYGFTVLRILGTHSGSSRIHRQSIHDLEGRGQQSRAHNL